MGKKKTKAKPKVKGYYCTRCNYAVHSNTSAIGKKHRKYSDEAVFGE